MNDLENDFFSISDKGNNFFTITDYEGRIRSFTYSGITDIDTSPNAQNLIISHAGCTINITGFGLNLIHKYLILEKIEFIFGEFDYKDDEGETHSISTIIYSDDDDYYYDKTEDETGEDIIDEIEV